MKKLCSFFALFLFLVFILVGCRTGPQVKGEQAIKTDLISGNHLGKSFPGGIDITSLKIIKRQTNQDAMSDTVYVEIDATSSYYQVTASYVIRYSLYDIGWLLDDVNPWYGGVWSSIPTAGIPAETIQQNLLPTSSLYYTDNWPVNLLEVESQDVDLSAGTSTVYYKYVIPGNYGAYFVNDKMTFAFNTSTFQYCPVSLDSVHQENAKFVPHDTIIGDTFHYSHSHIWTIGDPYVQADFYVTIDSIDGDQITGHGSYTGLHIKAEYIGDATFDFSGTIETSVRQTSHGYEYCPVVHMGDVNPYDGLNIDYWFTMDAREGIDYIGGDLL